MSRFKPKDDSPSKLIASNYFVNEKIRSPKVQVIDQKGENLGSVSRDQALYLAEQAGLDLVQVGQKGDAIITKIMDFGKFLYAKKKQLSEAKKKQKIVQIKEVKLRPNIDDNDYKTKLKKAVEFLKEGKKVKFTLQFRGREFIMMREIGHNFFERIYADLLKEDIGTLLKDKEQKGGPYWSIIYYLK